MRIQTFLRLTAITTAVIGTVFIIAPFQVTNIFVDQLGREALMFMRFLGSSLVGYSYLNWQTAKLNKLQAMHATLVGNFATLCIALLLSIIGVVSQDLNLYGLLIVALHLVFASGFGYYLLKLRRSKN